MTRDEITKGIEDGFDSLSTDDFIITADTALPLAVYKKGNRFILNGWIDYDPEAPYTIVDDCGDHWDEYSLSPLYPDLAEALTDWIYDNNPHIRSLPESVRLLLCKYSSVRVTAILTEIEKLEKELALATKDLKEVLENELD